MCIRDRRLDRGSGGEDSESVFPSVERRTNWHLLRLVRRRMILRFLRRKDDPTGGADGDDEGSAVSDDDGRKGADGVVSDESAGDAV